MMEQPLSSPRFLMAGRRIALGVFFVFAPALLAACSEPPTWQRLLTLKIIEQYPDYKVQTTTSGELRVERPGKTPMPVDADAIGRFCVRGPKDCNYATDQMLLELGGK